MCYPNLCRKSFAWVSFSLKGVLAFLAKAHKRKKVKVRLKLFKVYWFLTSCKVSHDLDSVRIIADKHTSRKQADQTVKWLSPPFFDGM